LITPLSFSVLKQQPLLRSTDVWLMARGAPYRNHDRRNGAPGSRWHKLVMNDWLESLYLW
jgi:hypothetical protein